MMKLLLTLAAALLAAPTLAAEPGKTPLGAPLAGNADGSLSSWSGPKSYTDAQRHVRYQTILDTPRERMQDLIYPIGMQDEKPLFTITRENLAQHQARLTPAQIAMFGRFKGYRMPIYPSRRTAFYSDAYIAATNKNRASAKLLGVDKVVGAALGIPFPEPKSGAEALWNHKLRYRSDSLRRYQNQLLVRSDGNFTVTRVQEDVLFVYANVKTPGNSDGPVMYYRSETLAPPKDAGQMLLVQDLGGERIAYIYNPGTQRVRRAPNVGYDAPAMGTDNQQFNDQIDSFNGPLDRYDWKLAGKREIYIPYNSLQMLSKNIKYKDIVGRDGINQDQTRYELHRVWVVEATLRPGTSHQFRRRTFYLDEDSWGIALVDCYDDRGQVWKLQEAHLATIPFFPSVVPAAEVIYDLQSLRYFVTSVSNEDQFANFEMSFKPEYFTPRALQTSTRR